MHRLLLICFLMGLNQLTSALEGNQLLFTVIGETTRESGYAHLVVPLPVPHLETSIDVLNDLIKTYIKYTMKPNNMYQKTESYGIDRIQAKINLILSLARQGGFVAKELHYDDVNLIMDGLRSLESRRKRSVAATMGALFGLASFGSSIYNTAQLNRLNEDRQRIEENQQFLMEELMEQNLRINNITTFIEVQYKAWVKQVKLIQESQRNTVMEAMGHQIHLLVQAFRMELTDFLTGITRLMDHRLSPLLVQPDALEEAFNLLKNAARLRNMRPMSEDAGILFQVPTSTFVDAHGRLFAITHLPLYAGDLLRLYRYVPAPFLLDGQRVAMEIISPAEYLALDTHGMVGKQLTASEFQLCRRLGNVYHCPNMNLVNKELKSLCLYNIYSQTINHIEDTCEVKIKYLRNHAVQLSTSLYRILAVKPVQLVMDCKAGSNVTTISGVHLLRLTEDCPKASTNEFLFVRTPDLVGYHELITLPLLSQAKEWLGDMSKELDLTEAMKSMEDPDVPEPSIPLRKFRNKLRGRDMEVYKIVESYLTTIVTYGVVLFSIGALFWCVYRRRRRTRLYRRPANALHGPGRVSGDDSDGVLMGRPAVALPPLVRRQFVPQ